MLSYIVDSFVNGFNRKRKLSDQGEGAPKTKRQKLSEEIDIIDQDVRCITNEYKDQISTSNSIQSLNQIIMQSNNEFDTKTQEISNVHSQITDEYKQALQLLEKVCESKIQPNVISYNSMIST